MLRAENLTRQTTLVTGGRVAGGYWSRLKGLIGVRRLAEGDGLAIVPCSGVHCMFMSIPIDVLYLDRKHRVVAMDPGMKPWAIGTPKLGAHYVIEMPEGTLARTGTQVGDELGVDLGK